MLLAAAPEGRTILCSVGGGEELPLVVLRGMSSLPNGYLKPVAGDLTAMKLSCERCILPEIGNYQANRRV